MKFTGYSKFLHLAFANFYGSEMARLTADQFELWWRSFTDEERLQEYRTIIANC